MRNSTDAYPATSVRVLFTLFYGVLSIAGVIGNILVVLVVTRVQNMLTPTNCYLISLAISDCVFLVTAATVELAYLHLPAHVYPYTIVGCRLLTYLPYLTINASSLSITAFTIERYIGICHPMKARYLCTVRRASVIIVCIWIFSFIYNSPWIFLATLKPLKYLDLNTSTCTFTIERQSFSYKVIFLADFLLFYLLPLMLYLFLYGRIALTLTTVQLGGAKTTARSILEQVRSHCRSKPSKSTLRHRRLSIFVTGDQAAVAERHQAVKMLVVIVLIFAISWLPYRSLVLYNSFAQKPWISREYIYFAKIMIFINCAINPLLYNLMSSRFRIAFDLLLKYGWKRAKFEESTTLVKTPSTPNNMTRISIYRNGHTPQLSRRLSIQPTYIRLIRKPSRPRASSAGNIPLDSIHEGEFCNGNLHAIMEQSTPGCGDSDMNSLFVRIVQETSATAL